MSLRGRCRRARCRDFDRVRKASAFHVEPEDWFIWNVHPFADETEVLERLGIHPSMCREADLYWRTRNDVYFVAFYGNGDPRALRMGSRGPRDMLGLRCNLAQETIEFTAVLAHLRQLHARGLPRSWCHRAPGRRARG